MKSIIAITALLTIIDGSCSVSAESKIARYNSLRLQYACALCTNTSIILIAKDTHLNSDQGQLRHGLVPRAN